jgi:hypothetical protein
MISAYVMKYMKLQGDVAAPERLRFKVHIVLRSVKYCPNEKLIF